MKPSSSDFPYQIALLDALAAGCLLQGILRSSPPVDQLTQVSVLDPYWYK